MKGKRRYCEFARLAGLTLLPQELGKDASFVATSPGDGRLGSTHSLFSVS
jgi:hypothetical protein